jgi:hypothetical protein
MNANSEDSAEITDVKHKIARAACDPLFIHNQFLLDGHTEKSTNGTATFVKFKGKHYACTCRHVLQAAEDGNALTLMIERVIFNLTRFNLQHKVVSSFSAPQDKTIDIAISPIDTGLWDMLATKKQKVPIDLDNFSELDWSKIKHYGAAGYPTEHKTLIGNQVQAPMTFVVATLKSPFGPNDKTFVLFSTLDKPHGWYFSGMSGGPIFAIVDNATLFPVGIVFEGGPSSAKAEASFISTENNIFIRGLALTPEIFEDWLVQARLASS